MERVSGECGWMRSGKRRPEAAKRKPMSARMSTWEEAKISRVARTPAEAAERSAARMRCARESLVAMKPPSEAKKSGMMRKTEKKTSEVWRKAAVL